MFQADKTLRQEGHVRTTEVNRHRIFILSDFWLLSVNWQLASVKEVELVVVFAEKSNRMAGGAGEGIKFCDTSSAVQVFSGRLTGIELNLYHKIKMTHFKE